MLRYFFFQPGLALLALLSFGLFVLKVWALIDCAIRPTAAFDLHGKLNKVAWLVILVLAVVLNTSVFGILSIAGTVAAIVYLVDVRPAVRGSS